MKKIMVLIGFVFLWVFPPKAWDQTYGNSGGGAEYMRQMQQQTINKKNQAKQQKKQNENDGLQQNQFGTPPDMKDQDAKQKNESDLGQDTISDKNN